MTRRPRVKAMFPATVISSFFTSRMPVEAGKDVFHRRT
jgi:hypothetical protein